MNKLIKILAVWILVFALPIQGFAASTMMNCEKSHSHHVAQTLINSHEHVMQSGHDESVAHQHVADAKDKNVSHDSSTNKHACSHCCTCTVCCSSTAIVATSLHVPAQFGHNKASLARSSPQFTSFISAGIERPPRSILV